MKTQTSTIILILALEGLLFGCLEAPQKRSRINQNVSQNQNPNPGNIFYPYPPPRPTVRPTPTTTYTPPPSGNCPYGDGSEPGDASGGQNIEYYKINNPPLVAHGASDGQVVWSSATNLSDSFQPAFQTDAKFNLRIVPRRQYFGQDSKGNKCAYTPRPYEKLQVGVVVRSASAPSGTGAYYLFDDVRVDCASKVHEFTVPENADRLVVEVKNVKWDWSCKSYELQGYPNVQGVCPWDNVWRTECYQVEIQFATDGTKDLPGPRTP